MSGRTHINVPYIYYVFLFVTRYLLSKKSVTVRLSGCNEYPYKNVTVVTTLLVTPEAEQPVAATHKHQGGDTMSEPIKIKQLLPITDGYCVLTPFSNEHGKTT